MLAYAYLDLLHPLGPVQSSLRAGLARLRDLPLPDLRSLPGCIVLLGLVLYPYVYLLTRALFLMRTGTLLEAARALSTGPIRAFLRVALPLARPAIALGTGLALMETLDDVGAAECLGVRTLAVQVYATWVNRSDLPWAAQIALAMLAGVVTLVVLERAARGGRGPAGGRRERPAARRPLRGAVATMVLCIGVAPVALGFVVPAGLLAVQAARRLGGGVSGSLTRDVVDTLLYAGLATVLAAAAGFAVAAAPGFLSRRAGGVLTRVSGLGYAIPGTVLVVGLLAPLAALDAGMSTSFGPPPAFIGVGTGTALVAAYTLRYLNLAVGAPEAGLARRSAALADASLVLGRPWS